MVGMAHVAEQKQRSPDADVRGARRGRDPSREVSAFVDVSSKSSRIVHLSGVCVCVCVTDNDPQGEAGTRADVSPACVYGTVQHH